MKVSSVKDCDEKAFLSTKRFGMEEKMKGIFSVDVIAVAVAVIVIFLAAVILRLILLKRRKATDLFEDMEGHDFEYFCADLLRQKGFTEVEVTKGSGDYGVDILAEKDGVTYGIQCKCYTSPVGVKAIQEAYAGRDYYDRMVGAVMTNQYFTSPAVEAAKKLKILLWDGGYIESMMEESP